MYFLQYRAIPNEDSPDAATLGGAFVNCWMDLPTLEEARSTAVDMILEHGWMPLVLEEVSEMTREECGDEGLRYFDQALIDKTVCDFYCWPIDAPDAEFD